MSDKKVVKRRDAIGKASCHRLLSEGSQGGVDRVSADAAKEARAALKSLLKQVSADCAQYCVDSKRQTINLAAVERAVVGKCYGIKKADLLSHGHKADHRGLAEAGVVRVVKKAAGGKLRVSDEAKKALVGAGEAYLRALGQRGSMLARAGGRKTLLENDVKSARAMLAE